MSTSQGLRRRKLFTKAYDVVTLIKRYIVWHLSYKALAPRARGPGLKSQISPMEHSADKHFRPGSSKKHCSRKGNIVNGAKIGAIRKRTSISLEVTSLLFYHLSYLDLETAKGSFCRRVKLLHVYHTRRRLHTVLF